ncbi:MAG TPA: ADP-ribosylglycohydrolase family protein [Armatimonadota bacterium]|nr:ADP-ribosylglycohydrolase family protein [Armatimonadota bacterium]
MRVVIVIFLALSAAASAAEVRVSREELLDHIHGGWAGMLIGGLEGLPHEFKYNETPKETLPEFTFLANGAKTDDDNDIEWTHAYYMDKYGVLKIPYSRIVEIWKANMNTRIWCANLAARKLMDEGLVPPDTGDPARNSYASYNLSGQFCVEVYGMIAPGMPNTAADIGLHYASIAVRGEPLQATRYWTALISEAMISDQPIDKQVKDALAAVDPSSAMYEVVNDAIRAWEGAGEDPPSYKDYGGQAAGAPRDWKAARQIIHQKWFVEKKWSTNSTPLNGGVVVLALLYGGGDFYKTLQYAMAMGHDADCNAATAGAVIGARIGFKRIQAMPQFRMPGTFRNITRPELPAETTVGEQAEMLLRVCEHVILQNGGSHVNVEGRPGYRIVLQSISDQSD